MAKKKKSPPSKKDGEGACGAWHYGVSILNAINEVQELENMYDATPKRTIGEIPLKIRIHEVGRDGVVHTIKSGPILHCSVVNGIIYLGTYHHLLTKERRS